MHHNRSSLSCVPKSILALLALMIAVTVAAQVGGPGGFDLSWNSIDSGGGTSTGGTFFLSGTIGQPDAGGPMTGAGFALAGGFWPGVGVTPDECPADINNSGTVDVDDLIAVILGWGGCANCAACPADTNHSCTVDVDDLIAVILGWGTCP